MTEAAAVVINLPGYPFQNLTSVATIAALRARSSSGLVTGDNILAEGRAVAGDGAGGIFVWNAASTDSDDGTQVIKPDDKGPLQAGRWLASVAEDDIREDLAATTGAALVNTSDGLTAQERFDALTDDIAALGGKLAPVTKPAPLGTYALPSGFNDQIGGTKALYDGIVWRAERSRYDAIDFTLTAATITTYYVDYLTGNDADTGLTEALAFKTLDKAFSVAGALAAGSNVIIRVLNDYVGFLSETSIGGTINGHTVADGKYVKIIGGGPSGLTRFLSMREDKDMATFAWVAHGSSGAWKSNVVGAIGDWAAQFWLGSLDDDGIPTPIVSAGQSAATVSANELTSFSDGTWLYVHLPNGAKPNPFNNWIYCNNAGDRQFQLDSGTLLFEDCEFFAGAVGVGANAFRFRSASGTLVTTARLGFRDCKFYGASANGLGVYDPAILVTENCAGGYNFNDHFNVHSFRSTGAWGAAITYYEDRARGHDSGYAGFAWGLAASASDNGSTVHDAASVVRFGSNFWNNRDAAIADVNGVDSVNFGVSVGPNQQAGASFYPGSLIYDAATGEGSRRRMVLIGCQSSNGTGDYSILVTGSATDKRAEVAYWRGDPGAALSGHVISYLDASVLNA